MSNKKENNTATTNSAWGGRFSEQTDEFVETFTASVQFDQRMYRQDIAGSRAHAKMLNKIDILSDVDLKAILAGLDQVEQEISSGQFEWSVAREDVHMNIEARLTELVGDAGKRLHTGRSRNDQVATDIRLYLREQITYIINEIGRLQHGIVNVAEREAASIMPGFTHLQVAQPVTFGHHLMAWYEMLKRDASRFEDCKQRMNQSPLGAAALAGTSYPIDREFTAKEMGFDKATENSLDSVSDRDFAIEFCSSAAILSVHMSRMSEELVMWSSAQFDFIELPDRFCTGSSIMPQKKNPDVPELVRGKTGRVNGNLVSLLTLMKSQPLAYNKDNQEDKEPLFDTVDTILGCLRAFADMIPAIICKHDNMYAAAKKGFSTATDLADYLVRKNLPFRDAHEVVGKAVALGINEKKDLSELSLAELQQFSDKISVDVFDVLTLEGSVESRNHIGGTAPMQVKKAIDRARKYLGG
jgi:argininosuccinate lyase